MSQLEKAKNRIESLERENKKLKKENEKIKKKCGDLEKRLALYENPHTPPSRRSIKRKRETKKKRKPKKRGAPKGHRGATRKKPKPDRTIKHSAEKCEICGGNRIKLQKYKSKTTEDIVIKKVVTKNDYGVYHCPDCGNDFMADKIVYERQGTFGPNILSLWQMMHYHCHTPFGKLAKFSSECLDINITVGGLHNVMYKTAEIFEPVFQNIKDRIIDSDYVGSDETKYSFNGDTNWLWMLSSNEDAVVLMEKSRGKKVLEKNLGEEYDGIMNSDCYPAYQNYSAAEHQKCWAHLLRSAKDVAKKCREGEHLEKELTRMFRYIKKVKGDGDEDTPKVKHWIWRQKKIFRKWENKKYRVKAAKNLVLRIVKYVDSWFTCLKYDFVKPTNNATERDIRKAVISRKISGQHRSRRGQHCREIAMSIILTSKKQDENPFDFIRDGIERYISGAEIS